MSVNAWRWRALATNPARFLSTRRGHDYWAVTVVMPRSRPVAGTWTRSGRRVWRLGWGLARPASGGGWILDVFWFTRKWWDGRA